MEKQNVKKYSLMVVGEEPEKLVGLYDKKKKVEPYIKYYYKDIGLYRKNTIKTFKRSLERLQDLEVDNLSIEVIKYRLNALEGLSDFEYYSNLTQGLEYDSEGNALSFDNPNGQWKTCELAKSNFIGLILKDGHKEVCQARKGEVDWSLIHLSKKNAYENVWNLFHGIKEPKDESEEKIYQNLIKNPLCFNGFDNVEKFIAYNASYWNNAYLDKRGWIDINSCNNMDWVVNYFENFIKPLNETDKISIYEYTI